MARYAAYLGVLVLVLIGAGQALAFGTIAGAGQNREHERITRHALACSAGAGGTCFQPKSIDELAGKSGTFGAVGAPDNPARMLLASSEAHCDNGDYLPIPGYDNTPIGAQRTLIGCRVWMERHMQQAVVFARALVLPNHTIDDSQIPTMVSCTYMGSAGRAKCNVLEELGLVLHASEDFYSHTNWTDLPDISRPIGPANPPGLGQSSPSPWINLRYTAPPFPTGLLSGCFVFLPESWFCNAGPGRAKHEFINKDKGVIDPAIGNPGTMRGIVNGNFGRAVQVAIADSRDKWETLKERLLSTYGARDGALMICAITHDDPAATCGAPGQRTWSPLDIFRSIAIFLIPALLAGGGYFLTRGRRRASAAS